MSQAESCIEFGDYAQDIITGYEGVVTYIRPNIPPLLKATKRPPISSFFDGNIR